MKNPGVAYGTAPGFLCLLVCNRTSARECANAYSFLVGLSLGGADIIFILSDGSDSGLDTAGDVL